MDVAFLVFLIFLNGLFAMSEMALTATRKARLQVMVETGDSGARAAMELHDDPTRFLSVVQIGITSIGLLNGIVGEAAFAAPFAIWMREVFEMQQRAAEISATALVVVTITFVTIIFGELVPKRLGQMYPESVARLVAKPMNWLAFIASPFVKLLAFFTLGTLALLGIRGSQSRSVTEEEITASLEEGLDAGVIEAHEHQMVRNVFRLDDRQVGSMMIPRSEIVWLDVNQSAEEIIRIISTEEHSRYPVCRNGLADVVGVISAQMLLRQAVQGVPIALTNLTEVLQPCVFVPETLSGMELLEQFRASGAQLVMVVDEYGEVQGMLTVRDVLEAITGEFTTAMDDDAWAVSQGEGGWIFDGLIPVPELKDRLALDELPEEDRGRYNTLAGMIMLLLGRVPAIGDAVDWENWRFRVVEMEGKRIDRVLATSIDDADSAEQSTDQGNP